ncbi:MAG: C-GCAxxG-C-C family protein [Clostridiales bacterium]|nr:C-GCAxxG-C-C family protein [Clostridiales bacterium]
MSEKGKLARSYFLQGYNCSQAVAMAFADELGIDKDFLAKAAIGFGGGMSRLREVCGAFSGIVLVLSLKYGDPNNNLESRKLVYSYVQALSKEFEKANGSIICRKLLSNADITFSGAPEERTSEYYKKRPCPDIIERAADILYNSKLI